MNELMKAGKARIFSCLKAPFFIIFLVLKRFKNEYFNIGLVIQRGRG
jgi:hypothetical protein